MKQKILYLLLFICSIINAQTFDWETATLQNSPTNPAQSAIQNLNNTYYATFFTPSLSPIQLANFTPGTTGKSVVNSQLEPTVRLAFDSASNSSFNIQSIKVAEIANNANWTFKSLDGGGNVLNTTTANVNSTASVVTLNWTNVFVIEISRTDGTSAHFYVDDIVFTPPPCTVNIPDANFKSYLVNNTAINTNGDTEIQCTEASAFTGQIYVYNEAVSNLTGIEAFVNLTILYCGSNLLTSLDVSNNLALEELYCLDNNITSLDLSANTALNTLNCYSNNLTSLNVANGNNTSFSNNNSFHAGNNPNLTCIQVDDATYSTANWTNIDAQTSFSTNCTPCTVNIPDANFKNYLVGNTNINTNGDTEIQCSEATDFTGTISVNSAGISDLTGIEAFTNLTELSCRQNGLTALDLSNNTQLIGLAVSQNPIMSLDVSNNPNLINFVCGAMNNLTTLNLANGNNATLVNFDAIGSFLLSCIQIDTGFVPPSSWQKETSANYSTNCNPAVKAYVNYTATGNNNGTTWSDAFTNLQDALAAMNNGGEIWIAAGTYKPHTSDRNTYFTITKSDIRIYGGFLGTEAQLSERILGTNETILSGDLQGNDVNTTNFASNYGNTTRNTDNSYRVINITQTGENLLLDGLTISDAHTNIDATTLGGAIMKNGLVANLTVRNCIIKNNVSRNHAAGLNLRYNLANTAPTRGSLTIDRCQFINNMSRGGSGIYNLIGANTFIDISISNSIFNNNIAGDLNSTLKSISGSSAIIKVTGNDSDSTINIYNNTYVNNIDTGTDNLSDDRFRATLAISQGNNVNVARTTALAQVANCIFWNNTGVGDHVSTGGRTRAISDTFENPLPTLNVYNSLDPLNFVEGSITSAVNTITTNPSFTSSTDFTLQTGSHAIDNGDNSKVIGNIDLLGNQRIFNTTIDLGAYEFGSSVPVYRTLTINATNGTVTTNPNPTNGAYVDGTSVVLTATPNPGYEFDGWSGDATGTANPVTIVMDADKTVTATFSKIQRTLTINTTNGTVATNPNPIGGTYDNGTSVVLTATPDAGYQFDGWNGDAIGTTNPVTITMDADKAVTAIFSLIPPAPLPTFVNSPTSISGAYTATINFSSVVTGFDMSDITVTGATLSNFTAVSGTEYTVLVTPTSICSTTVTLQVPANVAQDSSNVNNTASTIATINAVDNVDPTVVSQNYTLQLGANGQGTLTVANIDNGSSDNCAIATSVLDKTSFTCADLGANTVKLTVTDASNNSSDATVTVTVEDQIAPTVVAQNITVQLGTNGQVVITTADVNNGSSDNCAISSMSLDVTTFTCNNLGANNVVLTVEDASGNTNTATAVVTVNQNPNAQLAAVTQDITVQLDANGAATITPSQVDNGSGSGCNSNPILSLDKTSFTCADLGTNTVTLTATDSGNSVTNTATVTVVDVIAPTVVAQNYTLELDANGQGTLTVSNIDNGSSDNCAIVTSVLDKTSFDCSNIGANTVKLTVTDASNNSSDATVTVTVEDKIAPTVVVQNITVQLGTNGQVAITTADINNGSSDNCTISSMSLDVTTFTCNNLGANNVILTVNDASGNTNTATAVVTVNQNPNAQLAAVTQNITVQLDANGSATITPSQVDNGSGSGCNSNPTLSLDKTSFTCSDLGTNTVTLTATDSGNSVTNTAIVTVVDVIAPTVVAQNYTLQLDANGQGTLTVANIDNGSSDNCAIATSVLDKTSFDCSNIGANTVKLTITDASNNSSDATVTVTVEDKVAPTAIAQDIAVQLGAGGQVTITASDINNGSSDNCTTAANLTYSLDTTSFSCSEVGTNNIVLTVTDASGNSATASAVVTVSEDPNLPLSTVTQDITVQLDANGSVTITPSQVDNGSGSGCNSNPTLTLDVATFDCSNIGANTVTLTANDGTTSVTATATVTVEDKAAPTVTTQDVTVTLDANGQGSITIAEIDNGSTDNCGIDTRTLDVTSFTCADLGANTVTLTIVDDYGNTANATATVTVVETVAPTVLTQNITVAIDAIGNLNITPQQIDNGSTDACSGIAIMTLDQSSFSCPTLGDVTVTLTVTDVSGNSATKTAIVTITGPDEDNDGIPDPCDSKEIILSKGFSPNGDGQNDTWVIENIDNYPKNKVEIFNRWGEKVYQANNYNNDWDGKANQRGGSNDKLPVGSYLYIIHFNESGVAPIQGWLYINY